MKTYIIVTNDSFELPVSEEITGAEAAKRLGIPVAYLHQCLCKGFAKKAKYKAVVVADRQYEDMQEHNRQLSRRYAMTHDRREYYRNYDRRRGRVKCQTDQCLQNRS